MSEKRVPIGPLGRNIARAVGRIRKQRHMTYTELAKRLEEVGRPIPVLGLRRLEDGERRVDVDDLTAIATVLEVDPWSMTQPPNCEACKGAPPAGFTCNTCGAAR